MDVACLLGHVYALIVELEGHLVLAFVLVFLGDLLVHTDEILKNFNFDALKVSLGGLVKCSFELAHGFKFVLNILFTVTKSFVGKGLSFKVFEI